MNYVSVQNFTGENKSTTIQIANLDLVLLEVEDDSFAITQKVKT